MVSASLIAGFHRRFSTTLHLQGSLPHEQTTSDLPRLLLPPARPLRARARAPVPNLPRGGADARTTPAAAARGATAARGRGRSAGGVRRLASAPGGGQAAWRDGRQADAPRKRFFPRPGWGAGPAALGDQRYRERTHVSVTGP